MAYHPYPKCLECSYFPLDKDSVVLVLSGEEHDLLLALIDSEISHRLASTDGTKTQDGEVRKLEKLRASVDEPCPAWEDACET